MKARPTQSRKGVKGQLPLAGSRDSVPCGVWGNAPTVPRATIILNTLNKGAGSEASLPVTLRVRRRAPKLLFPQDSVKNPFFGADFLVKETHLTRRIGWMRCVLWLEFSMRICLCAAGERRGGGGDRKAPSSRPQARNPCIILFPDSTAPSACAFFVLASAHSI